MKTLALAVVLIGLLAFASYYALTAWLSVDAQMSASGWLALSLGVVLSILVGGGLMALLFYSARRGDGDDNRTR